MSLYAQCISFSFTIPAQAYVKQSHSAVPMVINSWEYIVCTSLYIAIVHIFAHAWQYWHTCVHTAVYHSPIAAGTEQKTHRARIGVPQNGPRPKPWP